MRIHLLSFFYYVTTNFIVDLCMMLASYAWRFVSFHYDVVHNFYCLIISLLFSFNPVGINYTYTQNAQ